LSYRPQYSKVEAVEIFFCSNYLICNPGDISTLQHHNWLSPLGLRISRDRRNQVLNPTRGYSALLDTEYAVDWTGSEFPYTRFLTDGTWYARGDGGWVLATHLRGGVVFPGRFRGIASDMASRRIVHPDKRFYAGGSNSVRGFPQNELGPRVLHVRNVGTLLADRTDSSGNPLPPLCTSETIGDESCDVAELPEDDLEVLPTGGTSLLEGSVEVRVPLTPQLWEGAAFLDLGHVWGENDKVRLGDLELTPGLGVRYFSPIGPIRVDLAYRLNSREALSVVTDKVRSYVPGSDDPDLRVKGPDGQPLDYMRTNALAVLAGRYPWGESSLWSLRRLQLNLSIGQAF
jgi:outer membrane protein insertion porin family